MLWILCWPKGRRRHLATRNARVGRRSDSACDTGHVRRPEDVRASSSTAGSRHLDQGSMCHCIRRRARQLPPIAFLERPPEPLGHGSSRVVHHRRVHRTRAVGGVGVSRIQQHHRQRGRVLSARQTLCCCCCQTYRGSSEGVEVGRDLGQHCEQPLGCCEGDAQRRHTLVTTVRAAMHKRNDRATFAVEMSKQRVCKMFLIGR